MVDENSLNKGDYEHIIKSLVDEEYSVLQYSLAGEQHVTRREMELILKVFMRISTKKSREAAIRLVSTFVGF